MSRPLLTALLAAGLLVRLAVLPLRGTTDVSDWKTWTANAARDLGGVYGVGPSAPVPNVLAWEQERKTITYPPLAIEELAVVGKVYRAWNPQFRDGRTFDAAVKVPGLLAELAFTVTLLTAGARRLGSTVARRAALAFWLNPVVILHGPHSVLSAGLVRLRSVGIAGTGQSRPVRLDHAPAGHARAR